MPSKIDDKVLKSWIALAQKRVALTDKANQALREYRAARAKYESALEIANTPSDEPSRIRAYQANEVHEKREALRRASKVYYDLLKALNPTRSKVDAIEQSTLDDIADAIKELTDHDMAEKGIEQFNDQQCAAFSNVVRKYQTHQKVAGEQQQELELLGKELNTHQTDTYKVQEAAYAQHKVAAAQQAKAAAPPPPPPPPAAQDPTAALQAQKAQATALADIRTNIQKGDAGDLIALHKLFDGKPSPADKLAALKASNQAPADVINGVSVQDLIDDHIGTIEQDIKVQAAELAANQIQAMIQGGNVSPALLQQIATNGRPDSPDQQLADLIKIAGDKFPMVKLQALATTAAAPPPPNPADMALDQVKTTIKYGNDGELIALHKVMATAHQGGDAAKLAALMAAGPIQLALLNIQDSTLLVNLNASHIPTIEQAIAEQADTLAQQIITSMISDSKLPDSVLAEIAQNGHPGKPSAPLSDLLKIAGGQFKAVALKTAAQQEQQKRAAAAPPPPPPSPSLNPAAMALADVKVAIQNILKGQAADLAKLFDLIASKSGDAAKLAVLQDTSPAQQTLINITNVPSLKDLAATDMPAIEQEIKDQAANLAKQMIQDMIADSKLPDSVLAEIAQNGHPGKPSAPLSDLLKITGTSLPAAAALKTAAQKVQQVKATNKALAQVKTNIQNGGAAKLIDLYKLMAAQQGGGDAAKLAALRAANPTQQILLVNVDCKDLAGKHITQIEQDIKDRAAKLAEDEIMRMMQGGKVSDALLQQIATNGKPDDVDENLQILIDIAGAEFNVAPLKAAAKAALQKIAAVDTSAHSKQQAFSRAVADIVAARREELESGQPFEASFEKIFRQTAWHKFDDPRANMPFGMPVNSDTEEKVKAAISEHGVDAFSGQELFKAMAISNHIFGEHDKAKPDYAHQIAQMLKTENGRVLLSQFSNPMHEITQEQVADLYKDLGLEGADKVNLPALQQRLAKRNLAYLLLGDVNQAENIGDLEQLQDYIFQGQEPNNGLEGNARKVGLGALNVADDIRPTLAMSAYLFRKLEVVGRSSVDESLSEEEKAKYKKTLAKHLTTRFEGLHNQSKAAVKAVSDCALYTFWTMSNNPLDEKVLARYEQVANNPSLHRNSAMRELRDNLRSTMGDYLRESGQALAQAEQMIAKYQAELRIINHQLKAHPELANNADLQKYVEKVRQDINKLKEEVAKIEPKYHRILNIYHKTTPPAENRVVTSLASIHQQTCKASELDSESVTSMLQRYDIVQQQPSVSLQTEEAHKAANTNDTVQVQRNHVSVDIVQVNLSVQVQQGQGENATTRSIDAVRNCMKTTSHDGSEVTLKGWAERPRVAQGGGTSAELGRPVAISDAEKKQIAIDFVKTWVRNNGAPSEKNKLHINGSDPQLKAFTVLAAKELCQNMKSFDADAGLRVDGATRQLLRAGSGVFSTADVEKAYKAAGAGIDKEAAKEFAESMKDTSDMSSTAEKVAADQQQFKDRLASVKQDRQVQPEPEHAAIPAARRP